MDWRLLHRACWEGDVEEVKRLLDKGADPNRLAPTNWRQRPLHRTLEFRLEHRKHDGHVEVVGLLLEAGADATLRATNLDMTPWELAHFCGLGPAERLLERYQGKAKLHPTGMTRLWIAAASRLPEKFQVTAVRRLLKEDTGLNTIWRSTTPVMMAVAHAGHLKLAKLLLEAGADPNAGVSLLHASCQWHLEYLEPSLKFMAKNGWIVSNADDHGQTALHKAAFLGYTKAVQSLLKLGADPQTRDHEGHAPLDLAQPHRRPHLEKLLA